MLFLYSVILFVEGVDSLSPESRLMRNPIKIRIKRVRPFISSIDKPKNKYFSNSTIRKIESTLINQVLIHPRPNFIYSLRVLRQPVYTNPLDSSGVTLKKHLSQKI